MAVDNDKLLFSSQWDIDQLVSSGNVAVGSGTTTVIDFSSLNLPSKPVFEVQFNPGTPNQWFTSGLNSTDGSVAGEFLFYCFISGSLLRINTDRAGQARYFLWADKVDY